MNAATIVRALSCGSGRCECTKAAKAGHGLTHCPAHQDVRQLSLNVDEGQGKTLLNCFAGCSPEAVMKALKERGLWGRPQGERPPPARKPPRRTEEPENRPWPPDPVSVYSYTASDGTALEKGRFERPNPEGGKPEKTFKWRKAGTTGWTGLGGIPQSEIRLWGHEELAQADPSRPVWFTEGEKACETLRARNELATCGPWGGGQTDFGQVFEALRGRTVRLWPDNDEGGRSYMQRVASALAPIAKSVVAVHPAGLPPKGDAFEFFQAGGNLEELLSRVLEHDAAEVIDWDHVLVRMRADVGTVSFDCSSIIEGQRELDVELVVRWHLDGEVFEDPWEQRINLLSSSAREGLARVLGRHYSGDMKPVANWTQLINRAVSLLRRQLAEVSIVEYEAPSREAPLVSYLVKGYVVRGGGTILHGQPKKGKSQLALALAVSVDAGKDRLFRVPQGGAKVLYVNLERSRQSMLARLARVNVVLGLSPERPLRMVHKRGSSFSSIIRQVRQAVRDEGIELVILDSISRGGFGDLNANQAANAAVDALNSLDIGWLAIGHQPRPAPGQENRPGHLYGSIHQEAGADVIAALTSQPITADRMLVKLIVQDANDIPRADEAAFVYEFNEEGLYNIRRARQDELVDEEQPSEAPLQDLALLYLRERGEPATTTQVAEAIRKDRGNTGKALAKMAKAGKVVKPDPSHWQTVDTVSQLTPVSGHNRTQGPDTDRKTVVSTPPFLRKGVDTDTVDTDVEDNEVHEDIVFFTCSRCGKEGEGEDLAAYDGEGREICGDCAPAFRESAG